MLEAKQFESMPASSHLNSYSGPERRGRGDAAKQWLSGALDEIDFGILLVDAGMRAIHVNRAARMELDASHPMQFDDGRLCPRRAVDRAAMSDAVANAATRGLRKQVVLGDEDRRTSVSVVPLEVGFGSKAVLLMFCKSRGRDALPIQSFASAHRLSIAETRVLGQLCSGVSPVRIAKEAGLSVATIRTQIASIREKTSTGSISELVRRVSTLPPLMCVVPALTRALPGTDPPERSNACQA